MPLPMNEEVWPTVGTDLEAAPIAPNSLNPRNLREAQDLARTLAVSGIVPKHLRGKAADILVIMLYGMELGVSVVTAMRAISVINGAPSMMTTLWVAKARERGHKVNVVCGVDVGGGMLCGEWADHPIHGVPTDKDPGVHPYVADHTAERCTVKARRRDTGEEAVVTWTIEQAIRANLIKRVDGGKLVSRSSTGEPLPWELYPEDQLYARAAARACRRVAPEVGLGLYTYEEQRDMAAAEPPSRADVVAVGEPVAEQPVDPDEARRAAQAAQDDYTGQET